MPPETASRPVRVWWAFAAFCVLKFILVSHDEVITMAWDDLDNARNAQFWHYGSPYGINAFTKQPGLSLFAGAATVFGLPLRLAYELLWMSASASVLAALRTVGVHRSVALLCSLAVLYHPWTFGLFERFLADAPYAGWYTLFIGLLTLAAFAPTTRSALLRALGASVAGAWAINTRPEGALVYLVPVCVATAAWFASREKPSRRRAAGVCLLAGAIVFGSAAAAAAGVKAKTGVFMAHELAMPGFKRLYNALLAIEPDKPHAKLPIPKDVRERAYAVSPTLATIREAMEGPTLEAFEPLVYGDTGVKGEHGAWAVWALRDATFRVIPVDAVARAKTYNDFWNKAANEVRAAIGDGRLPSRWVPISFVQPKWPQLAREAPTSFGRYWKILTRDPVPRAWPADVGPDRAPFDLMGLRRSSLVDLREQRPVGPSLWHRPRVHGALMTIQESLQALYNTVTRYGAWFPLAAFPALAWLALKGRAERGPVAILGVLLTLILARLALAVLLDACGVWAQHRYVLAIAPLVHVALWVSVAGLVSAALAARRPTPR